MHRPWANDFVNFLSWSLLSGWDVGLQIDRIDNDKNYSPDNCRWVPASVNMRNRSTTRYLEFNGERKCLTDWAEESGIKPSTLRRRLFVYNMPFEKAIINQKFDSGCAGSKNGSAKKVINTETGEIFGCGVDAAKDAGILYSSFKSKLNGQNKNKTPYRYL